MAMTRAAARVRERDRPEEPGTDSRAGKPLADVTDNGKGVPGMRKDVRLGLGVGGILFGVVLIYVLFFAGGKGDDQFAIDSASDAAAVTGGGGSASADSTAAGGSVKPYETGHTLVQTGPNTTTGTPQQQTTGTPAGGTTSGGNATLPQGASPFNGISPTTRPTGGLAGGFTPPTATASAWNWRELMDHGARNGQLLSF